MTTFTKTGDERTVEFRIDTSAEVTSFHGSEFIPNHCDAKVYNGTIVSLSLSRLEDGRFGIDDPKGPYGAELSVSFSGGELEPAALAKLPKVAQDALDAVKWAIR
jgi:hypothetical protein